MLATREVAEFIYVLRDNGFRGFHSTALIGVDAATIARPTFTLEPCSTFPSPDRVAKTPFSLPLSHSQCPDVAQDPMRVPNLQSRTEYMFPEHIRPILTPLHDPRLDFMAAPLLVRRRLVIQIPLLLVWRR